MSVTIVSVDAVDQLAVRVRFESDATPPVPFRVYREGRLVRSIDSADGTGEMIASIPANDCPYFEILDRDDQNPTPAFPGRLTLHWFHQSAVTSYTVQEYVGGVWTDRQTLAADGRLSYTWLSRWLEDSTTHQFRVRATGPGGTATLSSFTALMVRHPDAPDVTYTYDAGTGEVTVAAA